MSIEKHSAVAATARGRFDVIQVPTPEPGEEEVLVQVQYSSVIAFDTYTVDSAFYVAKFPMTLGFNSAGTVVKIGSKVNNLKVGDKVVTFAPPDAPHGKAMQEYAVLTQYCAAKVPENVTLPQAATVPDNFVTAYFVLFDSLKLPIPKTLPPTTPPAEESTPFLIYGAGATAGQYLIQLLRLAGYKSIIATASPKNHEYLKSLGATDVFDYSDPELSSKILSAAGGKPLKYAVDCVTAEETLHKVAEVVGEGSIVSMLLPIKEGGSVTTKGEMWVELPEGINPFKKGVEVIGTRTFTFQENKFMKENLMPRIVPELLKKGLIQPNRVRLLEKGSLKDRAAEALDLLRNNKISGEKVVVKV